MLNNANNILEHHEEKVAVPEESQRKRYTEKGELFKMT